jgi:hypothetical protein
VTEEEWLACNNPWPLVNQTNVVVSDRKAQLFACACCHRLRDRLTDARLRKVLEVAEARAEGVVTPEEVAAAGSLAEEVARSKYPLRQLARALGRVAVGSRYDWGNQPHVLAEVIASDDAEDWRSDAYQHAYLAEQERQLELLRDIFGNPFRVAALLDDWRTDTVLTLARQMYESRDFGAMPILADALQDAGCGDEQILAHCRGPGPHVRGCWVVDLVLGKE